MDEVVCGMTGPQLIGFVAVAGALISGTVLALAGIGFPCWLAARRASELGQLKRDLIAAGFKADEIERVVKATPPTRA